MGPNRKASRAWVPGNGTVISASRQLKGLFSGAIVLTVLTTLALAPAASADLTFGPPGSEAGQTSDPRAVAVDSTNGTVYVADRDNNRIDAFDSAGTFIRAFGWGVADGVSAVLQTCTSTCHEGIAGSGGGQIEPGPGPVLAVDNDPLSPAFHDVYVYEQGNHRVQRFTATGEFILTFGGGVNLSTGGNICTSASGDSCGSGPVSFSRSRIAVGQGGTIYMATGANRLLKFAPSGTLLAEITLSPAALGESVNGIAVDSVGNFYVASAGETGAIRQYAPDGTLLNTINPSLNILDFTVDSTGTIFVADNTGFDTSILEYSPAGNLLRVFYGDSTRRLISIAAYSDSTGEIFAIAEGKSIAHIPFPPPGPVVAPGATAASSIGNQTATLNTSVNPENASTASYFEYVDQQSFEAEGFSNPSKTPQTDAGSDFTLHRASQEIAGLTPETTYHIRAVATNANGTDIGAEAEFNTLAPFEILSTWTTSVDTSSATLHSELNPQGIAATGYFQYVDDATYKSSGFTEARSVPAVDSGANPLDFGAGFKPQSRSASAFPLQPDTTYHYRLVVSDSFVTETGAEHTFTTAQNIAGNSESCLNQVFRTGASARLPDCRAYEMVSPLDKNNGDILPGGSLVESDNPTGSLDQAAPEGERITYNAYRAFAGAQSGFFSSQYLATRDPQAGWLTRAIMPPRVGHSLYGGTYVDGMFKGFSPDLCKSWILQDSELTLTPDAVSGYPGLYSQDNCGDEGYRALSTVKPPDVNPEQYSLGLEGFSTADGSSYFAAMGKLLTNASDGGNVQLYVSQPSAKLKLVSVLPNGQASTGDSFLGSNSSLLGYRSNSVFHAVSADGSRAYWSSDTAGSTALYLRKNPTQPQSGIASGQCTQPERACTVLIADSDATFWGAAENGSIAFFTKKMGGDGSDLFEFNAESESSTLIAHDVRGVMGESNNASLIYFVSEDDLASGGIADKPNLYLDENGKVVFVATLLPQELTRSFNPIAAKPLVRTSRVSADGEHAVFVTGASPTGYDSADAKSGEPDGEMYLFDATAGEGKGKLICVSCNPTGARPVGEEVESGLNGGAGRWAAAEIPGWQTQYQPTRILSDGGDRVFFESFDPLLPRDTNGKKDVYEWEASGSGNCEEEDPAFSVANSGCVDLISTGESPRESEFVDASSDGSDVFFTTLSGLVPQDYGLIDIYDARIGGGFPPPFNPPASCEGEACQGPLASPNDPTPGSSSYQGPGNPSQTPNKKKKKHKRKTHKRQAKKAHGQMGGKR